MGSENGDLAFTDKDEKTVGPKVKIPMVVNNHKE